MRSKLIPYALLFFLWNQAVLANSLSLDDKLRLQWNRFASAREALAKNVGCNGKLITRAEWEKMIELPEGAGFTQEDLKQLQSRQHEIIEKARAEAIRKSRESGIDFEKIKTHNAVERFCSALPKGAMLHVHPSGTIDQPTAMKLLNTINPDINPDDISSNVSASPAARFTYCEIASLQDLPHGKKFSQLSYQQKNLVTALFVLPQKVKQNFAEFQGKFRYMDSVLWAKYPTYDPSSSYTSAAVLRVRAENVDHVEFTKTCPSDSKGWEDLRQSTRDQTKMSSVSIRYNCSFDRTDTIERNEQKMKVLFGHLLQRALSGKPEKIVGGIDLLGDESAEDHPERDVSALASGQRIYACLLELKSKGLKIHATMHAGEFGDARNPRDALVMGVDRIGHGVLLEKDPVALEYARLNHTGIEVALTSNLRLGAVSSLETHPYLNYLRLGIPVSLSTDDDGILETDINNECVQAINHSEITYEELKQMSFNAISTSFLSDHEKVSRLKALTKKFAVFEKTWSGKIPEPPTQTIAKLKSVMRNPCVDSVNKTQEATNLNGIK